MKKIMLLSILFVSFGFVPHVLAQSGFVPLAPIPGLTQGVTADQAGLASFFNNLYKYLIGLAAALAVIMITWGGLEIAMNKDDVSKITDSKGRIYNAIFGLVLVLSPVLVFSIINPSILNLSLNLPPLDTKSTQTPTSANTSTTVTEKNNTDVGANVAQLQQQCRDKGGTPQTNSNVVGGTVTVTCDMSPPIQAGSQITPAQCANLPSPTMYTGYTCSTAPTSMTSFQQAGGYTCNDLVGGGLCLHK
ncbi:hypothetical protein KGQ72_02825 [Patescibacteria group bacterium]|nr:hypothetical protein [Patescibacteria group bacterium]